MEDLEKITPLTVDEVNARLPLVRRITSDHHRLWEQRRDTRERIESFLERRDPLRRDGAARPGSSELIETLHRLKDEEQRLTVELAALEEELAELEGIMKDPRRGLVDFLSLHEGRLVFISWMLGEERAEHWYELDGKPSDRRSLRPAGERGAS